MTKDRKVESLSQIVSEPNTLSGVLRTKRQMGQREEAGKEDEVEVTQIQERGNWNRQETVSLLEFLGGTYPMVA